MAKAKSPEIDPGADYSVALAKAVEVAPGVWARPGDAVKLKGRRLSEIRDAVSSFVRA